MRIVSGGVLTQGNLVLLVKKSDGTGWILPKGGVGNLLKKEAALKEVYEEAGVLCTIGRKLLKIAMPNEEHTYYHMPIVLVLNEYPEKMHRKRKLFTIKEAKKLVPSYQVAVLEKLKKELKK